LSGNLSQSRSPDLTEVIQAAMGQVPSMMYVAGPGIIQSYDENTRTAEVLPGVSRPFLNSNGTDGLDELQPLKDVPVLMPGGGGFFFKFPIQRGDLVLLVYCDNSIDSFIASGGKVQTDPVDLREHDISDAVAIPGFYTQLNRVLSDSATAGKMAFGADGVSGKYITIDSTGKLDVNGNFTVDP